MAAFVDETISAQNTFTSPVDTASESRVQICCAGDGAEGFGSTVVTIQAKPTQWPATQWVPVGTISSGDSNGQAQFIEVGANLQVRAGVATGNFDVNVNIFLAT